MKKQLLTLLPALGLAVATFATAPQRRQVIHTQPDGTQLTLTVTANGRFTTYTTTDGVSVLRGADGHYYYAALTGGTLAPTALLAHEAGLRTESETQTVGVLGVTQALAERTLDLANPVAPLVRTTRAAASTTDGLGAYKQPGGGVVSSIGAPVIPVVMVNFADRAFQDTITVEKVTRFFNETGYSDETGCPGSVKDYFVAQSNGLFAPQFDVVAHVTLPQGYQYYGKDSASGSTDPNTRTFVTDALAEASRTVNFADYATDDTVPLVAFMFAGPGQQSSFEDGHEDYLWAKFASGRNFTANNGSVTVSSYFIGNELLQTYGSSPNDVRGANLDGVGLFCHEFGHALGLPDFYYTGSNAGLASSLLTMDYWSIMDYGQYYYNGYAPPGYTAYERSFMGWLDVKELTDPQFAELYPFGEEEKGATAYVIRNPEDEREYYLLENRQPGTWYPRRMGSGLLITHVDYDRSAWAYNTVNNNADHQRMAYVPADNVKDGTSTSANLSLTQLFNGYKGDLFPGTTGASAFTDDTTPAATLFQGTAGKLGKPLYNIEMREDGVVTFSFRDPEMTGISPTPAPAAPDGAEAEAYTLSGLRVGSLRTAAPGVYILRNGQKVVKR